MEYIKTSWKRERKTDVPVEVLENIAARGSFVVIRSKMLYRDFNDRPKGRGEEKAQDLSLAEQVNQKVRDVNLKIWMGNLADNIPTIKASEDISQIPKKTGETAIIVGAGPSFKQRGHMKVLAEAKNHTIITTDRMLVPMLEANITPDFVVSVDGHREAIVRFYESELVSEKLTTIGVMGVTVAPNVVQRFSDKRFFFTPMLDDIDQPVSLTSAMSLMTGTSILATGGNVGITSTYFAFYLGFRNIILTGLDLGYTADTPIENSAYYPIVKEADPTITPERYKKLYVIEGYNPDFQVKYYTDVAWKSHIDDLVRQSKYMHEKGVNLINATEGGSVHGGAIISLPLKEAISRYE